MKWFSDSRIMLLLLAFAIALMFSTGNAEADFTFGTPTKLGPPLSTSYDDSVACISADGLEMYLNTTRPGGFGNADIWVAKRETTDAKWGAPANLGSVVNSAGGEVASSISDDGLELYLSYSQSGGYSGWDIWVTMRATKDSDWGPPVNLGPIVNRPREELGPWISADGLELYFFVGGHPGATYIADIWVARRETKNDPWRAPVKLGPVVNSPDFLEGWPCLSANGLLLFFSDFGQAGPFRPGGPEGQTFG